MLNNNKRCIFIGLPSSGKSSFIGALWYVVESGEIESSYTVTIQPKDREYLNHLRTKFLNCDALERTNTEFVEKVKLEFLDRGTGDIINFLFPDLSGETYESQFEDRQITNDYLSQLEDCNSCILFINPDYIISSVLINEIDNNLFEEEQVIGREIVSENKREIETEDNLEMVIDAKVSVHPDEAVGKPWKPRMCQTQVKLVDLLQIIQDQLPMNCKVGVIISAWDVIRSMPDDQKNDTPDQWLKKNLPLLNQYLVANQHKFPYSVFGISAQGGVYSDQGNLQLQGIITPSERIIVQSGTSITHDITVPLKWLFE